MLIESKLIKKEGEEYGYVEAIYDSSNLMKTIYFPHKCKLYVFFNKGIVYSYSNISAQLYYDFESAESQGKFLNEKIKKGLQYSYYKEFKLLEYEIKELKNIVETFRNEKEEEDYGNT
jgi:hypothetical protein